MTLQKACITYHVKESAQDGGKLIQNLTAGNSTGNLKSFGRDEVGIRKSSFNCLDCTAWIINANHTHPASEACKLCYYYEGIAAEGVYCAKENPKEEKKVEDKYKVIKEFTKYDYIVQHQKKYGWTSFKDSCAEFQKDMEEWIYEPTIIPGVYLMTNLSPNFYKHGVMFGFLEKVEPEVFYSAGDIFEGDNGERYKLIIVPVPGEGTKMLFSNVKGKSYLGPLFKVENTNKITQKEIAILDSAIILTKIQG